MFSIVFPSYVILDISHKFFSLIHKEKYILYIMIIKNNIINFYVFSYFCFYIVINIIYNSHIILLLLKILKNLEVNIF